MVAAGNDFVLIDNRKPLTTERNLYIWAKAMCDRKYGAGADGLLVWEKSKTADARMRIFNADGSEAEMCGNGSRCFAFFIKDKIRKNNLAIATKAGIVQAQIRGDNVRVNLTDPKEVKFEIPIKVSGRTLRVNFINTGVPHTVIFVQGLENIDVERLGRQIRFHKRFAPKGTNVNFVEVISPDLIRIRTYERGVEAETLACGTGSTASALIAAAKSKEMNQEKIDVLTKGGEILKIYFKNRRNKFKDVWLEGRATIVYKGVYNV
jgi:diaminopimelate epimerase